ncbi:group 1 truncated hemoglobin [Erythrobacteraceae bacterium WH01K]|nr:group 1 truncated hemoglobin [Erythrobacteraceae bacterium WH01K]
MIALTIALLLQQAPPEDIDWDAEFGVEEQVRDPETGELPVDPYVQSNDNAGADPFGGSSMAETFGGQDGIRAITNRLIDLNLDDPRISDIFVGHDMVRLRRTLFEQFCYILAAGCDYTGRDMRASHDAMGVQRKDMNALVENLQQAMREQDIPFAAQNRLLAKLAPMSRDVIER